MPGSRGVCLRGVVAIGASAWLLHLISRMAGTLGLDLAELLGRAGEEDLLGVGGDDAVEGELAGVLAAEFEEEAGAVAGVGIDDVDELHLWGAIEVGGVGDALDGGFDVAETVVLGDDGDVAQGGAGASGVGGVDVGGGAAVAEGVGLQVFIEEWGLRGGGGGGTAVSGRRVAGGGFLYCGGGGWESGVVGVVP